MKVFLSAVLISFFVASAVFGVYAMNHEACFSHGGCLVEVVQNNLMAYKEEKINLILLAVAAAVFLFFGLNWFLKNIKLFLYFSRRIFNELIRLLILLTRWLAILQNSPSEI